LDKHIFRYNRSTMMPIDLSVVIIVLVISLGSWIIYHGDVIGGAAVILIGCGLFVPLYINAKLVFLTLCVDEEGVTATAFGHTWKFIGWKNVNRVVSAQWTNVGYLKPTKTFLICSVSENRLLFQKNGPIIFNDTIIGFKSLLDILHEKACVHRFKIARLED
jgi:hypothetical protein